METFIDIIKNTIPALVVVVVAYLLVRDLILTKANQTHAAPAPAAAPAAKPAEVRHEMIDEKLMPMQLQAYERLVLYLERISPNNLVMRVYQNGMSGRLLRAELLKAIRSEYEHNFTQQLYVSPEAWNMVKNAKEELNKLINVASQKAGNEADGLALSTTIFEIAGTVQKLPTDAALEHLKKEMQDRFIQH